MIFEVVFRRAHVKFNSVINKINKFVRLNILQCKVEKVIEKILWSYKRFYFVNWRFFMQLENTTL